MYYIKIMKIYRLLSIAFLLFTYNLAVAEQADLETDKALETNISEIAPEDLVQGNRESKVLVIEYFSPTCPHCAYFNKEVYSKLKELYIDNGKIAYLKREFVGTKQDLDASVLARCGGDMKRLAFYDILLKQQESWAFNRNYNEILTNIGQIGGVSPEQYKKCLDNKALGTVLMNNTKLIARIPGFIGTPVFVINNKIHNGKFSIEELSKIISEELEKTGK